MKHYLKKENISGSFDRKESKRKEQKYNL